MKKDIPLQHKIIIIFVLLVIGVSIWNFVPDNWQIFITSIYATLIAIIGILTNAVNIIEFFQRGNKKDSVLHPKTPPLPDDIEMLPISFTIYTNQTPHIEILLHLVNHKSKERTFHTLEVLYFNISGISPAIERIPTITDDLFLPHKSKQIIFRRALEYSVVDNIKRASPNNPCYADFAVRVQELSGRKIKSYLATDLHTKGYIV